jgi:hypothetical protein
MRDINVLFLFCEGPHDVAFCYLVMKYFFGMKTVKDNFSSYPSPLHKLLPQNLKKHAAGDMSLDMAHKFFLPDRTVTKGDDFVLLFNTGGKTRIDNPKRFLHSFLALYENKKTFSKDAKSIVHDVRYLFLYDADHEPATKIFEDFRINFNNIDNLPFITQQFDPSPTNPRAAVSADKGVYILGDTYTGKGTLEDILLPIYAETKKDWCEKAGNFIDETFSFQTEQSNDQQHIAARSRRAKAVITAAGQEKKPGRPMAAIIQDDVLGSKDNFLASEPVREFADFIHYFANIPQMEG